jgi:signal transduction histidine kinase
MQAIRRLAGRDPWMIADAVMGIAVAGLAAVAVWGPHRLLGTPITGPLWLRALLPVFLGVPLVLRRRAPLLMWIAAWAGLALETQLVHFPLVGAEFTVVLFVAAYSLGAHASLRRGVAGLVLAAPFVIEVGHQGRLGLALSQLHGGTGAAFWQLQLLAFWLAGVFVHARRQAAALAARNAALQRQAEHAVAAERARIAGELHDIVAHHLSVMVLLAAGARASGTVTGPALENLENIENSGRKALAENRRLLDVLRDTSEDTALAPQPGIGELDALAASVRAAGQPVNLVISGDPAAVPAAVDVSVYHIVQEALTNVLKHAGRARADVTIGCADEAVTIEVTDNGTREPGDRAPAGGHGLAGMRERVAVFGGELHAGPRPGGGFAVRARLPLGDGAP